MGSIVEKIVDLYEVMRAVGGCDGVDLEEIRWRFCAKKSLLELLCGSRKHASTATLENIYRLVVGRGEIDVELISRGTGLSRETVERYLRFLKPDVECAVVKKFIELGYTDAVSGVLGVSRRTVRRILRRYTPVISSIVGRIIVMARVYGGVTIDDVARVTGKPRRYIQSKISGSKTVKKYVVKLGDRLYPADQRFKSRHPVEQGRERG